MKEIKLFLVIAIGLTVASLCFLLLHLFYNEYGLEFVMSISGITILSWVFYFIKRRENK